jgi:hypothetical protein
MRTLTYLWRTLVGTIAAFVFGRDGRTKAPPKSAALARRTGPRLWVAARIGAGNPLSVRAGGVTLNRN